MIRKSEAGQALVMAAVAMVVLLGIAGLAIDMGVMRYDKRLQQTAADAAAIAGASNLAYDGAGSSGVTTGALAASAQNGFANTAPGGGGCTTPPSNLAVGAVAVTVCNPPRYGPHTGNSKYVEAYVSAGHPTFFMRALGVPSKTITARAVATNASGPSGSGSACIYTLGEPSSQLTANSAGFGTSGSVVLNAPDCGIVDNGNFVANGGKQLSVTAASISVAGTYDGPSGSATVSPEPCTSGTICNAPSVGDPLADAYPTPTIGTSAGPIKITAGTCSGTGCSGVTCSGGSCTIQPGTYDDICIDNNQTVDFSDGGSVDGGLFVITGASTCSSNVEFEANAGSTICSSTNADCSGMAANPPTSQNNGVTFYIGGTSASVNISGTANAYLVAPNSGTYEGMLFYQSPSNSTTMNLLGTSDSYYQGTIYTPNPDTILNFGGNTNFNSLAKYTFIIVGQLQLAGNPDITINADYSSLSNGGGPLSVLLTKPTLVE